MIDYGKVSFWTTPLQNTECKKINLKSLKLKVNYSFKKNENITTNYEPSNDEYEVNKAYLDTEVSKVEDHILFIEKDCNKYNDIETFHEEFLIERAVKTTGQELSDKKFFKNYDIADRVP